MEGKRLRPGKERHGPDSIHRVTPGPEPRLADVPGASQHRLARACPADLHPRRAGPLGGAPGASVPDLRPQMAGAAVARRAGPVVPVAHQVRGAALRLRPRHADRHLVAAPRVHRHGAEVVDGGARHPVLAPHRACAAARPGPPGAEPVQLAGADQHRPALDPPRRAAPDLQHDRLHPHGDRHVLPHVPAVGRSGPYEMHLRLPAAPVRGLSRLSAAGVVERFLRWRHARTAMQLPLFAVAVAMVVHGFLGPQLAPRNLATLLTWVHYRGALVLVLLAAGNLFCMACPFMLPRTLARRFFKPTLRWPRRLRSKWLALGLFVLILYAYELFDLWSSPWWTAWLIVAYFATALAVDSVFKDASFCKWVCPLGQFNFVASTVSPLEVRVRDADACLTCTTHDCIKGTRDPVDPAVVLQQGCELGLFLPKKTGNMDCTFCLDCVHACPHDNVVLATRVPGSELWTDPRRSGVGFFSKRKDLSALVVIFTLGALLNAFGMVSPVYALESWLAARMGP